MKAEGHRSKGVDVPDPRAAGSPIVGERCDGDTYLKGGPRGAQILYLVAARRATKLLGGNLYVRLTGALNMLMLLIAFMHPCP